MRGFRLILLSLSAFAAAPASACFITGPICMGDKIECHPSPDERRAREHRSSTEETRRQTVDALDRLRTGKADPAAELAEALVPNIRPVRIQTSDCGPVNEIDHGAGRESLESVFAEVAGGTQPPGAQWSDYDDLFRIDDIYPFGERCNAEYRARFAAHLRRTLSPERLRQAWLFLNSRRRSDRNGFLGYYRLIMFEDQARTPPVRWIFPNEWIRKETLGALRRTKWGPDLQAAADAFWGRNSADLADDARACPAAAAEWAAVRAQLRAKMPEKYSGR